MIKTSDLTKDFYSSGDVAKLLGVVPMTVINYDNQGIMHFERTITNRRVISKTNLINYLKSVDMLLDDSVTVRFDAVYGRVSTNRQAQEGDLNNQINTILTFAATQNPINLQVYKDIGSGLDDCRKGLTTLLRDVQQDKINRIFITYKDRLTRFGFNYIQEICTHHNTQIVQVSDEVIEKTVQEELAEDLCAIIHSFSSKLYSLRRSQLKTINSQLNNVKVVSDENETG